MIAQNLAEFTDDELYDYWQERVAVRFEDGREESIDQVKHMEAKALMAQLSRPLPFAIRTSANRWRSQPCQTKSPS